MSRVANNPITIPAGIEVSMDGKAITIKSSKVGNRHACSLQIHPAVEVTKEDNMLRIKPRENIENADAFAGTIRALINNMIIGLEKGFEKKLTLIGVGYRVQVQGKKVNLALGFSHPINYQIPDGISIETPSQTEIVVKGVSKQLVGQVAADIRAFRPPEPYKGKGVRYADEEIILKEGKKK
jgi:large subunit ribosomal protein L6